MLKKEIGRVLLSVALVGTAVVSVAVDWNASHVFNPEWTPHARFHDVVMLWLLCGISIIALWLLWRQSLEPNIGGTVAALVPIVFWLPFFFMTLLVPGTSLKANPDEVIPSLRGIPLYPNVVTAAICVTIATIGYWLYRTGKTVLPSDES